MGLGLGLPVGRSFADVWCCPSGQHLVDLVDPEEGKKEVLGFPERGARLGKVRDGLCSSV